MEAQTAELLLELRYPIVGVDTDEQAVESPKKRVPAATRPRLPVGCGQASHDACQPDRLTNSTFDKGRYCLALVFCAARRVHRGGCKRYDDIFDRLPYWTLQRVIDLAPRSGLSKGKAVLCYRRAWRGETCPIFLFILGIVGHLCVHSKLGALRPIPLLQEPDDLLQMHGIEMRRNPQ